MKKQEINFDISKITSSQLKEELNRVNYKSRYNKLLRNTIYSIIIIAAVTVLIATLIMPVLEIKGTSMSPKYNDGDIAVSLKTNKFKENDVIAFYYGNKILVKRVIAVPGDWVVVNDDGSIYVNSVKIREKFEDGSKIEIGDTKYPYQVPDSSWFVLGDDIKDPNDSRNSNIGAIEKDNIIGKVLFRIWSSKKN